jgi:hypothetical protein
VNNYVKQRLLPPPVNKKYSRKHLALLIMICTFKQSLSMAAVSKMLPTGRRTRDHAGLRAVRRKP